MARARRQSRLPEIIRIDDVDRRILTLLQRDGRLSARAIARDIRMSAGAVSERLQSLERTGIIRGYAADVDLGRLGAQMLAIVGIQASHDASLEEIQNALLRIPECEHVYVVTGDWDLLVHFRVRDHLHLRDILFDRIWKLSGFRRSATMIVLEDDIARQSQVAHPILNATDEKPQTKVSRKRNR